MSGNLYKDPIIEKYRQLIEDNSKSRFKKFYQGDPIRVPASLLPCIIFSKQETRVGHFTNSEDEHACRMLLTVITDIRRDLNDDKGVVAGIASLYDLIEGRNDSDYTLKEESILGILRNNVGVDTQFNLRTDLDTITRVDYGMTINKREEESWATEGQLEFIAHFIQER